MGQFPSYSGFFTVNETYGSNMFFWFFPAQVCLLSERMIVDHYMIFYYSFQSGNKSAPLLLWLQGGPGASSLFGLFVENGPLAVDKSGNCGSRTSHMTISL